MSSRCAAYQNYSVSSRPCQDERIYNKDNVIDGTDHRAGTS